MLNAGEPRMPSFSCSRQATFGKMRSGVVVRVLYRGERGAIREIAGRLVVCGNVPLLDSGPRADPFVGGLDHLLEVEVRQDLVRQVASGADYARIHS